MSMIELLDVDKVRGGSVKGECDLLQSVALCLDHVCIHVSVIPVILTDIALTSVKQQPLNDDQRHVDDVILPADSLERDSIHEDDIGAGELGEGVPYKQTLASHGEGLDLGRV